MEDIFKRQCKKALELRLEPVSARKAKLKRLEKWVLSNRKRIQEALFKDFGKRPEETDLSEIYVALTEIREARKHLRRWTDPSPAKPNLAFWGTKAYVQYEPKGVSLIISPWNFPFNLAVGPLVSAIAAGCTVCLKPSEFAPHTSALLKTMASDLFDDDEVAVFEGDRKVSSRLLSLPFNHIFFTGSPAVGKIVMEAASRHLCSVTLELGGKSPVFVDETADITDAAQKLAWAKWMNAGQTCTAPDYVLVHESRERELQEKLGVFAEKLYKDQDHMTCIINETHFRRMCEARKDALEKGAKEIFSLGQDTAANFFGPTVLSSVAPDSNVLSEEIFGPILPILTYSSLDEAISLVNKKEKPLSLYVFSKSRSNIKHIMRSTSSGTVVVNDAVIQFGHPELPFGGVNNSGFGKSHGRYGFIAFSNEKAVLQQRVGLTMAKTLYPPYSRLKKKTIEFMLRFF